MKISDDKSKQNILHHIRQVPENQKVTPTAAHINKNEPLPGERVELSEKASDLNKIRELVLRTPDIREEKVELLREKIASGSYNVSSQEIADKMLREYLIEDSLTIQF